MSSVLGTHGGRGSSVYAASKAGIIGKSQTRTRITLLQSHTSQLT